MPDSSSAFIYRKTLIKNVCFNTTTKNPDVWTVTWEGNGTDTWLFIKLLYIWSYMVNETYRDALGRSNS